MTLARLTATLMLFGCCVSAAMAQDLADVDIAYEKHVLDNGLTVLIHEDHTAPQAFVSVYYKVGSRDEVRGKTGFAHLFEHLMFNGTENYDEDYFAPVQDVGGTLNGDTWLDRTRYYQTVPNTALERVLWLESERMGHLLGAVTQEKLDQQRGVVQNEKRRKENKPYAMIWPNMQAALFPDGHPYQWSSIGSMEDLNAASLEDVHEWFRKYYGAANAILTVAGDVDPAETLELVKLHFGDIPAGPPVTHLDDWVPVRLASTSEVMQDRAANELITRGWAVPGREHDDTTMLQIAAYILAGDASSRLPKRLVKEEKLATSVFLSVQPFDLASMASLSISLVPGADGERARAIVEEEIAAFAKEGPTKSELELTKISLAANIIKRLDSLAGKANRLAESEYYLGSADAYKRGYELLDNVTREDLRRVVGEWLGAGFHEIHVLPYGGHAVAETGADRSKLPEVSSYPSPTAPAIQDFKLDNGIKVRFVKREGIPAVRIGAQFPIGSAMVAGEKPGAAGIALATLTKGTRNRDADEIVADSKRSGSSLSVGGTVDSTSAWMTTLASRIDPAVELFADVLRNPGFPEDEVEILREQTITGIAQGKTNPQAIAGRFINDVVYGDHPYGRPPTTEDDIRSVTIADLRAAYEARIQPQHMTIYVVGGIEAEVLRDALNEHLGDWRGDAGTTPRVDVNAAAVAPQAARVILFDTPGASQSNIFAATAIDAPYGDGDEALSLANKIYGGTFTSRINTNIREEKGWSYGVRSAITESVGPRLWQISAQVQTDKTSESIVELLNELDGLTDGQPFTAEELDKVRNEVVRRMPATLATANGILGYMVTNALYGRPDDFIETRQAAFEAVSVDALAPAFFERVQKGQLCWFIAGDLEKIEEGVRALELGDVEIWDVEGNRIR